MTGGRGFVGKNLVSDLSARGRVVLAPARAELDLRDADAVARYCERHGVATIVHAAGRVGGIAANTRAPVRFFIDNALAGIGLLEGAAAAGVPELLNLSSSCAYPRDRDLLREEDVLTGPLEPTNEAYALAKLSIGRLCTWMSGEEPARRWRTAMPCNLYGPHDRFDADAHLVASAIAKLDLAVGRGEDTVEIWGDGEARREFMHVRDLCDAVAFLLDHLDDVPDTINVGVGADRTVNEYYAAAANAVGFTGRFVHDLARPVGMQRKLLDVSRLSALGWTARIPLGEGLADTYSWYRALSQERFAA